MYSCSEDDEPQFEFPVLDNGIHENSLEGSKKVFVTVGTIFPIKRF